MTELPYHLDRTVQLTRVPETVFRFFTDSARWANRWGAGSTIDATPGGKVYIRHANGIESLGEVLEVHAPERIVFLRFLERQPDSASEVHASPSSLRRTIPGTRLHLLHEFAEAGPRDEHIQGWRFQLSLFGNAVANEVFADAAQVVDDWFLAWMITRTTRLEKVASRNPS